MVILVTLVTFYLNVLIGKGIFCFGVVRGDLFPTLGCVTLLAYRLSFMGILMTGAAFFELIHSIPVVYVTLSTLSLNMFASKGIL